MRKIVLGLAAMALIFTSCSKDEVTGVNDQNPDVIGFFSSTSRATINNLATLQGSTGFKVYGTSAATPAAWHTNVNGLNNYAFSSGAWGWAGSNGMWPTVATGYPMTFYAMYPLAPAGVVPTATPSATPVLTGVVTIQSTAATQVDLLAAKVSTATKPGDGKLPLTFKHILSKVNFGIIAGNAKTVIVQAIGVKNVSSVATYNYVAETWGTPGTDASFDYFRNTATPFSTLGVSDETTVAPIYTGTPAASAHLMLMPQTHTTWNKTATALTSGSYVEVIYRVTAAGSPNNIGYTAAADYLKDYTTFANDKSWGSYTGLGTTAGKYNGKLFVKVGFPMDATSFTWAPGKGYTYNIGIGTLGSSNGYYTDETYYDENGVDTGIEIVGPDGKPVKPGDPVSDGIIHFLVNVTDWDDLTPVVLP